MPTKDEMKMLRDVYAKEIKPFYENHPYKKVVYEQETFRTAYR